MKRRARQQEFGFTNWGGKRRGAGRKRTGERARVSHSKRAKLAARFPVLVTLRLCDGLRSLRTDSTNAFLRSALAAGSNGNFRVVEFSIQRNHLHAIVEAGHERLLSRAMNGLATRIARGLNVEALIRGARNVEALIRGARGRSLPFAVAGLTSPLDRAG
jgi:REP element-mobilizing transposase RayT